ncbi:MAG: methyltransferase family protein [Isosphaeraceae bacterium]
MESTPNQPGEPLRVDRRRLLISLGGICAYLILGMLLPAGTWKWPRGWLSLGVMVGSSVLAMIYLSRVNPEIIAARVNRHAGTKRWDKILLAFFFPAVMAIPVVAALDDGRFHWLYVPWLYCVLGYVLLLAGMAGLTWAESVNRFFEPTVRIQSDRGHNVVDTGPYTLIRHPGYVSACSLFIGLALALGSLWALVPALSACALLVVRTVLEDRMLYRELPGYEEYARRVRYRLVPGVW